MGLGIENLQGNEWKVEAKKDFGRREQTSEQEKLPRAIISIVALRAYTRALAKFDTRT